MPLCSLCRMSYIQDGMRRLRDGTDDPWNRIMGGVTAGGLLGLLWWVSDMEGEGGSFGSGGFAV